MHKAEISKTKNKTLGLGETNGSSNWDYKTLRRAN